MLYDVTGNVSCENYRFMSINYTNRFLLISTLVLRLKSNNFYFNFVIQAINLCFENYSKYAVTWLTIALWGKATGVRRKAMLKNVRYMVFKLIFYVSWKSFKTAMIQTFNYFYISENRSLLSTCWERRLHQNEAYSWGPTWSWKISRGYQAQSFWRLHWMIK